MSCKHYINDECDLVYSDDMIFEENLKDIIDDTYIKEDWHRDPEEVYIEILKENTKLYNDYIKGKF